MDESRVYTDEDAYALKRRRLPADDPFSEMRQKLIAFWVLARFPWRFQFALLGVLYMMVFGRVVYNAPLCSIPLLIAAFFIVSLINAGGCAINDYFDLHADAISKPERPIPAGNISAAGALEYTAVTFVIGAALALYINLLAFVIVLFEILFFVAYPSVLKRASGLWANFLMGLATGLIAVFGEALLLGHISYLSLAFVPMAIAGGKQANAFKDTVTMKGDKRNGYATVAVKRGVRAEKPLSGALKTQEETSPFFLPSSPRSILSNCKRPCMFPGTTKCPAKEKRKGGKAPTTPSLRRCALRGLQSAVSYPTSI
jgi:4-hydroxybenzoate polyprenyltransferase